MLKTGCDRVQAQQSEAPFQGTQNPSPFKCITCASGGKEPSSVDSASFLGKKKMPTLLPPSCRLCENCNTSVGSLNQGSANLWAPLERWPWHDCLDKLCPTMQQTHNQLQQSTKHKNGSDPRLSCKSSFKYCVGNPRDGCELGATCCMKGCATNMTRTGPIKGMVFRKFRIVYYAPASSGVDLHALSYPENKQWIRSQAELPYIVTCRLPFADSNLRPHANSASASLVAKRGPAARCFAGSYSKR